MNNLVKVILISFSAFIAVATGGYCIMWFAQASQIKHGVEQTIAKINEQQKYLTYDAIETSGFPGKIYVSIVKPHFVGRIDTLLKPLAAKAPPGQAGTLANMPEWNEDALLDGRVIIGINALSNKYSLHINGNWHRTSIIGGQTLSIVSQSSGDSMCTLKMAHSGGILGSLWDYRALVRDNGKDFIKDLRLFDCSGMANEFSDATSHEKLVSNGPWRFYVSAAPQGDQEEARFYLKIADAEVTPQGDAMMTLQRNAFSPNSYPVKYSLFGKQNMEIDFAYTGPSDWQAAGKNPPLDIKLSKFDITNQMYTSSATFFLTNGMNGENRAARLAFNAHSNYNESYDAFLQDVAHGFIQQAYAKPEQFPPLQPYLQKYTQDEFYSIIYPAIPHLHPLGQMVQALDISYQGTPDLSTGNITLSDLELSASPYGIKGSGTAKRVSGQPLPSGQALLICTNCERMLDDITAYAARLQKTMSYFQTPEQIAADTPIDSKLADGIKGFAKAIAEPIKDSDPDKTTLVYSIISDGTIGITISGKNLNDVMAMYKEYIGSVLKANQPATAAPVPATESAPAATTPVPATPAAPVPAPTAPAVAPAPAATPAP